MDTLFFCWSVSTACCYEVFRAKERERLDILQELRLTLTPNALVKNYLKSSPPLSRQNSQVLTLGRITYRLFRIWCGSFLVCLALLASCFRPLASVFPFCALLELSLSLLSGIFREFIGVSFLFFLYSSSRHGSHCCCPLSLSIWHFGVLYQFTNRRS